MKSFALSCALLTLVSCGASTADLSKDKSTRTNGLQSSVTTAVFSGVKAGEDYPTDSPQPARLNGMKVLVLKDARIPLPGGEKRIIVNQSASLVGGSTLVLSANKRIAIKLQSAIAGIDYPTDVTPGADRGLIWELAKYLRVDVMKIYSIELARAGVDYPTDSPHRNFYVVVMYGEDGFVRKAIP